MVLSPSLSLPASDFFSLSFSLHRGKEWKGRYLFPDTSSLFNETSFADVGMSWHEEGLTFGAEVHKPLENPENDYVELFIDTRDLKTAGFPTRFCHHFSIVPAAGISREITRFRTEDSHPLCESEDLKTDFQEAKTSYKIDVFIPTHCLHGYDPHSFDRLGFTYILHRHKGELQHFAVSSHYYAVDQQPSLWASLKLIT